MSEKYSFMKKTHKTAKIIFQDNFTDNDFVEYLLYALQDIEVITSEECEEALTHGADVYPNLIALFDISPEIFYRHFVEQDDDGEWLAECLHSHLNLDQPEFFIRDGMGKPEFRQAALSGNIDSQNINLVNFFVDVLFEMDELSEEESEMAIRSEHLSKVAEAIDRCIEYTFTLSKDEEIPELLSELLDDDNRLIFTDSKGTWYVIDSRYDLWEISEIILKACTIGRSIE